MARKNRDLLTLRDMSAPGISRLINSAIKMKTDHSKGRVIQPLKGKVLGLFFSKPSTRTRISFQAGMAQLGGTAISIPPSDIQLNRGESLEDTARVLSRYLDGLVIRTFEHSQLEDWAHNSSVPVINGLSDSFHPCQVLSDLMTVKEHFGKIRGVKIAYIGDGNNVAHSWLLAAGILGLDLTLAVPKGFDPDPAIQQEALDRFPGKGAPPRVVRDPGEAALAADVLYTDVWTSMGQEKEKKRREKAFRGYQINEELLSSAKPGAVVMHCLPAHRGEEITAEAMDGPRSLILDQAENRLHLQKALLLTLLGGRR